MDYGVKSDAQLPLQNWDDYGIDCNGPLPDYLQDEGAVIIPDVPTPLSEIEGGGNGQRPLSLVYPSAFGYTGPHLRERFGQAVAYIRPLKTDLEESPLKQEVTLMQSTH